MPDKILFLVADDVEDLELFYPYYRLKEAGFVPVVASADGGTLTGKHGYRLSADTTFADVKPEEYAALVLPGGKSPERVRLDQDALKITRHFVDRGAPVAAICHGPQILISAGRTKGRKMTSWNGIRDDLAASGAIYEDGEAVTDGNMVTSRRPGDLPAFMGAFLKLLSAAAKRTAVPAR
ncbi:MAG: type 1 glutamine amidotransferase [Nitrososphaerota archaeon]|nr:type 1 glutamine amidotransferase [Nitrososphaerota archaeon]MDG6939806.1 type 1 glutamine amidotransferase [Nitrososphaerota archaeon]